MNAISKSVLATAVVAGAMAMGASAAQPVGSYADGARTRSVTVHIGDLNARTPAGARRIFWRLQRASEWVCGYDPAQTVPLQTIVALHGCEQNAIAPAVVKIDTQPLTAAYYRHYKQPLGSVKVGPIAVG